MQIQQYSWYGKNSSKTCIYRWKKQLSRHANSTIIMALKLAYRDGKNNYSLCNLNYNRGMEETHPKFRHIDGKIIYLNMFYTDFNSNLIVCNFLLTTVWREHLKSNLANKLRYSGKVVDDGKKCVGAKEWEKNPTLQEEAWGKKNFNLKKTLVIAILIA